MSGFVNTTGTQYFIEGIATLDSGWVFNARLDMTAVYSKDDACEKKLSGKRHATAVCQSGPSTVHVIFTIFFIYIDIHMYLLSLMP